MYYYYQKVIPQQFDQTPSRGISPCSPCISPGPMRWPPSSPAFFQLTSFRGGSATASPDPSGRSFRYSLAVPAAFARINTCFVHVVQSMLITYQPLSEQQS